MLKRLTEKDLTVTELAAPFDMSLAAVSKHIKVLEEAEFIRKKKSGRTFHCSANLAPLQDVTKLLEDLGAFWREQLSSLDAFLSSGESIEGGKNGKKKRR